MKSTLNLFKLLSLIALFIFQSCSPEIGIWKNEKIEAGHRSEMGQLNKAVFEAINANDDKSFSNYLSSEMLEGNLGNKLFSTLYVAARKDNFVLADEFYAMNKEALHDTIPVADGKNSYKIIYGGEPQEVYIATFLPKVKKANQYMITLFYGHYNYGWKIKDIDVALYKVNGKTSPELFETAKSAYAAHNVFAAANNLQLAQTCASPNKWWKYNTETDLYATYTQVISEVNKAYRFPITLNDVSSKPEIVRVYNTSFDGGTFPNICYVTRIKLSDVAALERENAEIRKSINKVLPGVEKHVDQVVYSAYNDFPDQNVALKHYDMKVKGL
ncbi:hypothetical protein D0C36_07860 [Mucilaginibacter conchicola]|uniref:Lipoprotein n=1 Tax=Mucilaginibacter conchicola TaxID=2303333 RepID=A0A372P116_9SPHI|nr:hypothetical protein [Mucilaginibacter conchicola]RFZ95427.1 hypothetical protein D0C36_07860 [Mucilaginibacter conchicola]